MPPIRSAERYVLLPSTMSMLEVVERTHYSCTMLSTCSIYSTYISCRVVHKGKDYNIDSCDSKGSIISLKYCLIYTFHRYVCVVAMIMLALLHQHFRHSKDDSRSTVSARNFMNGIGVFLSIDNCDTDSIHPTQFR
jgi:hypothetical protein